MEEARAPADAGCDVIMALGIEAGGHMRDFGSACFALLDALLPAVDVPVLATGGLVRGAAASPVLLLASGGNGRFGTIAHSAADPERAKSS